MGLDKAVLTRYKYKDELTSANLNAKQTEIENYLNAAQADIDRLNTQTAQTLATKASIATKDLTYYVDGDNGDDNNDGLTEYTAFKTIQKAVSSIPNVLFTRVVIYVADGTYEGNISCISVTTQPDAFHLIGNTDNVGRVKLNGTIYNYANSEMTIRGIEGIAKDFIINVAGSLYISDCKCISAGGCGINNRQNGSILFGPNNEFSNKEYAIANTYGGGLIEIGFPITGSNNKYSLWCASGIISKFQNGAIPESIDGALVNGGIVTGLSPTVFPLPLASGYVPYSYDRSCEFSVNAERQVTIQFVVKKSGISDDIYVNDVIAYLPYGYTPKKVSHGFCAGVNMNNEQVLGHFTVYTNGAVALYLNQPAGKYVLGSISFYI